MRYTYTFSERVITIDSDTTLSEDPNSALFKSAPGRSSDLVIRFRHCRSLPKTRGELIWQSEFFRLFKDSGKYQICSLDRCGGGYLMTAEFSEDSDVTLWVRDDFPHELARTQQIWQAVSLTTQLMRLDVLPIHSSSVAVDGGVILFCGRSGIGKSTQASLWAKHENALILNGDRNALTLADSGTFAHGLPFCGTSGICRRYDLPLRAVVALEQSPENSVARLSGAFALRTLTNNALGIFPGWLGGKRLELFLSAAERIPIYKLSCTPDVRAVRTLKNALF